MGGSRRGAGFINTRRLRLIRLGVGGGVGWVHENKNGNMANGRRPAFAALRRGKDGTRLRGAAARQGWQMAKGSMKRESDLGGGNGAAGPASLGYGGASEAGVEGRIEGLGVSGEGKSRRNGNVARLAKGVRDKINEMIEDGVTYREIITRLGEEGDGLIESNLTRWKEGGYQDWLAERAFMERIRARQETPRELVRDFDATEVNHAALQLGTLHIFEALREIGPGSLNEKLGGDCGAFARLINALARASRETMQLQRYREACAKARAALRELDPNRKLDESETRAIVRQVDELLGLAQREEALERLRKGSRLGAVEEGNGMNGTEGTNVCGAELSGSGEGTRSEVDCA